MIIGIVVAIILVWWFFLRKKKAPESNYRMIRRRRVVGALSPELLPIEPASNVYTTKLDFLTSSPSRFECPKDFVWTGPATGCVHKDVLNPPTT